MSKSTVGKVEKRYGWDDVPKQLRELVSDYEDTDAKEDPTIAELKAFVASNMQCLLRMYADETSMDERMQYIEWLSGNTYLLAELELFEKEEENS